MLRVHVKPALNDNYIFVIEDTISKDAICVDPAEAKPVNQVLEEYSLQLKYIFNTHHHYDHVGANLELKETHKCEVVAYAGDLARIPGNDIGVKEGDTFPFEHKFEIILYPRAYPWTYRASKEPQLLFAAILFSMGCGRLFEGSLNKCGNP